MEVLNIVQEPVTKTIHKKKKCKSLHIAEKRKKKNKIQGEKGKTYPPECRVIEKNKKRKENLK